MNTLIHLLGTLLISASVTCVAAESKPWLSLPSGVAYPLSIDKSGAAGSRIAVQEADASAKPMPLDARVFDVSYKDERSKELVSAFSAVIEDASATAPCANMK